MIFSTWEFTIASRFADIGQVSFQVQFDIIVHQRTSDIVKFEDVRDGAKRLQSESFPDRRFRTTGDEELGLWNFVHVAREHRKKCRGGFPVLALVKGIDDDQGRYSGFCQRANDDLFYLGIQRFPSDVRAGFQDFEQLFSELWISVGKLEGEGREDGLEVAPILKVP